MSDGVLDLTLRRDVDSLTARDGDLKGVQRVSGQVACEAEGGEALLTAIAVRPS